MAEYIFVGIIEKTDDGHYHISFPELPGCVSSAPSLLELEIAAQEALALHIKGMLADGDKIPTGNLGDSLPRDPEVKEYCRAQVTVRV